MNSLTDSNKCMCLFSFIQKQYDDQQREIVLHIENCNQHKQQCIQKVEYQEMLEQQLIQFQNRLQILDEQLKQYKDYKELLIINNSR